MNIMLGGDKVFSLRKHIFINVLLEIKKKNTVFDDVFEFMTEEEQLRHSIFSLSGQIDIRNHIVYMGSDSINRLISFKQQMIDKYYKQVKN